jgi:pimeloyl-ACP methyl ester carboxylesterase
MTGCLGLDGLLAGDATYHAEFLRSLTGPIVLVGHSYGGNVISNAATGNDQVRALAYFNGWMCDEAVRCSRAIGPAGVEEPAVLVPARHRGQGDPVGAPAVYG